MFRANITRDASQRGLAITRLQARADGSVQLVFSDVSPTELYAWLVELAARPGGNVRGASITGRGDKIQASIELQGAME